MDGINFCGKTQLILNENLLSDIIPRTNARNTNIRLASSNPNLVQCKLFTTTIDENSYTIFVRNDKEGFLHRIPLLGKAEKALEDLAIKVDKLLNQSKENFTAWIIGGSSFENPTLKSADRLNEIAEVLCDNPKIDTSILSGIKNAKEHIAIKCRKNITELMFPTKKGLSKPNNPEEFFNKNFEYLELNNVEIH